MTRDSNRIRLFINGVLAATTTVVGVPTITASSAQVGLVLGQFYSQAGKQAFVNNLRIVTGAVVYSTASTTVGTNVFTPSSTPLNKHSSGNTVFLLKTFAGTKYNATPFDNSNGPSYTWIGDAKTGMYHVGQGQIGFTCLGSSALVMSNANVGIGAQPVYKFDVSGNTRIGAAFFDNVDQHMRIGNQALINSGAIGTNYGVYQSAQGQTVLNAVSNQSVAFKINNIEYFRLHSNGNIGYGTTEPASALHVQGTGTPFCGLLIQNTGAGGGPLLSGASIDFRGWNSSNSLTARIRSGDGQSALYGGTLQFYTKTANNADTDSLTEKMRITDSGNIGIGTTNPQSTLHIHEAADNTSSYVRYSSKSLSGHWYCGQQYSGNSFVVYNDANAGAYLTYGGTSWSATSDRRLKENIMDCTYGLDAIVQMRPVQYNYIGCAQSNIGLIAQDLKNIVPEIVSESWNEKLGDLALGLDYNGIIPILIKAIQEQNVKILQLQQAFEKLI